MRQLAQIFGSVSLPCVADKGQIPIGEPNQNRHLNLRPWFWPLTNSDQSNATRYYLNIYSLCIESVVALPRVCPYTTLENCFPYSVFYTFWITICASSTVGQDSVFMSDAVMW